jgi:membrane associated rhomboid family serine protease
MFPIQDTVRTRSFPIVNWLLIISNVAVFVLLELPLRSGQLNQFVLTYGLVPVRLVDGQPWSVVTILTSMFLHGGWLHLISNMWALFIFGDNVEGRMGPGRYLIFYLLGGVVASLTQVVVDPASRLPMVGASGAIAGVLGAYLILFPSARVLTLVPLFILPWFVEVPAFVYLGIWFLLQFLSGVLALDMSTMGGVAYWAHIGGFVCGLLLVRGFARRSQIYYRRYASGYRF